MIPRVRQPLAFVNVENLVATFLQNRAELSDIPVAVRLPDNYDGVSPIVILSRVGGEFSADDRLDHTQVRVDTYGPDRIAALDLAGTVRGLIWLMPDASPIAGTTVADVAEQRGPSRLRDHAFPNANRYTTRFHILVRIGPSST